jgi:DNA-binding FadR family transcriptional regulator
MAADKESAPSHWGQLSQDERSALLAMRLMIEPEAARLIAQRVMGRLARLQPDNANTAPSS